MLFKFWSDTNFRLFTDTLDDRGVSYQKFDTTSVVEVDDDLEDWAIQEAYDLGADLASENLQPSAQGDEV